MIWRTATKISSQALKSGALQPIASQLFTTFAHNIKFTYHLINEGAHKKPHQATQLNPYLSHALGGSDFWAATIATQTHFTNFT